ncbi:hypothetical protein JRQ81_005298 [Phrynocephalus forsythii]|uniref:Uncharacterized protein n=1 Tax=Phrynocephalus forsythii TaxID=171643 RepID=A0A9Q0Y3X0_9SAUR|nr:hypothetical protein JRQ81_005298 [Phrynocephalus forsythii]
MQCNAIQYNTDILYLEFILQFAQRSAFKSKNQDLWTRLPQKLSTPIPRQLVLSANLVLTTATVPVASVLLPAMATEVIWVSLVVPRANIVVVPTRDEEEEERGYHPNPEKGHEDLRLPLNQLEGSMFASPQ